MTYPGFFCPNGYLQKKLLHVKAFVCYFLFFLRVKNHLKSSFRSQNIQIFVFFSPSFPHIPESKGQVKVECFML